MDPIFVSCAVNIDYQQVIAVSLGKLAASRGQKGGINLHRSLLLTSVLHKARNAFIDQHKQELVSSSVPMMSASIFHHKMPLSMAERNFSSPTTKLTTTWRNATSKRQACDVVTCVGSETSTILKPIAQQVLERNKSHLPMSTATTNAAELYHGSENYLPNASSCSDFLLHYGTESCVEQPSMKYPMLAHDNKETNTRTLLKRRLSLKLDNENVTASKVRIKSYNDSNTKYHPQISCLVDHFGSGFVSLSNTDSVYRCITDDEVDCSKISTEHSCHVSVISFNDTCSREMNFNGIDSLQRSLVLSV